MKTQGTGTSKNHLPPHPPTKNKIIHTQATSNWRLVLLVKAVVGASCSGVSLGGVARTSAALAVLAHSPSEWA